MGYGGAGDAGGLGGGRRLTADNKIFETKFALDTRNQFDGVKNGVHWKGHTHDYLVSRYPKMHDILQWVEQRGSQTITTMDASALQLWIEDDVLVISHLLWGYLNICLTGEALEIFRNVQVSNGLEVWRRLAVNIADKNPARKDDLLNLISNPAKTNNIDEVDKVLESWDTNLRIYRELGGEELSEDMKKHILKKIVPHSLTEGLTMHNLESASFATIRGWMQQKAKAITTNNALNGQKVPLNIVNGDMTEEELDELLSLSFEEAFDRTGQEKTFDNVFALQAKLQARRAWNSKRANLKKDGTKRDTVIKKGNLLKNGEKVLKCANCGKEGHDKDSCRLPKKDIKDRPCHNCGKPGHVARDCPEKSKPALMTEQDEQDPASENEDLFVLLPRSLLRRLLCGSW